MSEPAHNVAGDAAVLPRAHKHPVNWQTFLNFSRYIKTFFFYVVCPRVWISVQLYRVDVAFSCVDPPEPQSMAGIITPLFNFTDGTAASTAPAVQSNNVSIRNLKISVVFLKKKN